MSAPAALAREALAALVVDACVQDVRAFKPGNVAIGAPGHRMAAEHFVRSASAAALPLTRPGATVGERIEEAIAATWQVVDCNTNLGIVLLLAPLLHAAQRLAPGAGPGALRPALQASLAALDVADALACYRAIRQARPGGLGHSARHDVGETPRVTLLAAMQEAADRDGIAREYAHGFAQVFDVALPCLQQGLARGEAELWTVTRCFLALLASAPDGHVLRRHGASTAAEVSHAAAMLLRAWSDADRAAMWPLLRDCDRRWKAMGINPGTTADLVVAALAVMRLHQALGYNGARHSAGTEHLRERPDRAAPGKRAWAPSH